MNDSDKKTILKLEHQVAKIFEWRRGFNYIYLIKIGLDLGIFKFLADTPYCNPQKIAKSLSLYAPYVDVWCKTAFAAGILETIDCEHYCLGDHYQEILANESHPSFLGGYVKLGTDFAAKDFEFCIEAFKTGSKIPFQNRSQAFAETVGVAISGLHSLVTHKIIPNLPGQKVKLLKGCKILDVGCGTGKLVFRLAEVWKDAEISGVDIDPTGLKVAKEQRAKLELEDKINLVEGRVRDVGDKESFDVITMIEVLHEISPEARQSVIDDCYSLLRSGGWLVIIDETYPSEPAEYRQPEYQFPIQTAFEELTWGNTLPTKQEQEKLLSDFGLKNVDRKLLGEGFTLLSVRKD